jgi:hypothetical protein
MKEPEYPHPHFTCTSKPTPFSLPSTAPAYWLASLPPNRGKGMFGPYPWPFPQIGGREQNVHLRKIFFNFGKYKIHLMDHFIVPEKD